MANLPRGRPPGNRQTIDVETSPPARQHATSYGGADAGFGSGGKRSRQDDDDAPLVMQEMPSFNISNWKLQEWRSGLPSYDDKEDAVQALRVALKTYEGAEWSTSNPHLRRVYDFASKHHQQVKCLTSRACVMCQAAGSLFSFKGDATKKNLPIALYVEAMKTYSPIAEDFDTEVFYANDPAEIECGKECVMLDENHDCFLDGNYEMRYCQQCYPDLSEAIETFESFLKKPFRSPDSSLFANYKKKKTEIKEDFMGLLRKIAIMSHIDWVLHIHSNKHTGRRQIDVPAEVDNMQTSVGEVKKQIMQLEVVLKHEMNDMVDKVKKHAPPHRHLLEAETEQFVGKLLDPTREFGKLTKNLSTLFGKDGKADFFETMTEIFEKVVTNMELPIAPDAATASKVFIQGKMTEIRDNLTEFMNIHVVPSLKGISTRVGAIDHIQQNLEAFFNVKDFLKNLSPAKDTLFSQVMELLIRKILKEFTEEIDRKFDKELKAAAADFETTEGKLDTIIKKNEEIDKKLDAVLAWIEETKPALSQLSKSKSQ
jgi:hypothetical protein